ncbi:hypothetical protein FN846DRAFT_934985 [Sphaerosporella brunnea]|uniref:Uncharacterized protein n=1 Tax=Sphaerosporella brunnea TaxID=1250544 RepID=A0A5J5F5S5_9PEZI|nr:hypothetical protein FN846DRAFT_934985 [Sphaerosporella brunnea]
MEGGMHLAPAAQSNRRRLNLLALRLGVTLRGGEASSPPPACFLSRKKKHRECSQCSHHTYALCRQQRLSGPTLSISSRYHSIQHPPVIDSGRLEQLLITALESLVRMAGTLHRTSGHVHGCRFGAHGRGGRPGALFGLTSSTGEFGSIASCKSR